MSKNYLPALLKNYFRDVIGKFLQSRNYRDNIDELRLNFPPAMCANVHTYCNLSCVFCPYSELSRKDEHGLMDFDLFKKLLKEFSRGGGKYITFNNFSEIFAHKMGLDYVLEALTYNTLQVYLVTNGINLSEEIVDTLLGNGFNGDIYISCHAFSEETYEKVTKHNAFNKVKKNVTYLVKKYKYPQKIIIQFICDYASEDEILSARNYWKSLDVTLNEFQSHTFCNKSQHKKYINKHHSLLAGCKSWGHDAGLPFYQIVVQHNGIVTLCCMDVANEVIIGDVSKLSIESVWNSKKFKELIEIIYCQRKSVTDKFICNRCPSAIYLDDLKQYDNLHLQSIKLINKISQLM